MDDAIGQIFSREKQLRMKIHWRIISRVINISLFTVNVIVFRARYGMLWTNQPRENYHRSLISPFQYCDVTPKLDILT